MKANEAPEKIYLTSDEKKSFVFTQKRSDNKGIEYTRTDAFIEKAIEYIITHIPDMHTLGVSANMDDYIIKDFRNNMKGE